MRSYAAVLTVAAALLIGPVASASCPLMSAADVQQITGVEVRDVGLGSKPGAGGKCANYLTSDGKLFLGVTELGTAADFRRAVNSVPKEIYPKREKVSGVADEAVLFKSEDGRLRYLVARKGEHGIIIFPFHEQPSDQQLKQLATLALAKRD